MAGVALQKALPHSRLGSERSNDDIGSGSSRPHGDPFGHLNLNYPSASQMGVSLDMICLNTNSRGF